MYCKVQSQSTSLNVIKQINVCLQTNIIVILAIHLTQCREEGRKEGKGLINLTQCREEGGKDQGRV